MNKGGGKVYACLECQHVFEEPMRWTERHGLEHGPFEEFSGCPMCGGGYVKTYKCDVCDNYILDDYIKTDDGMRYCENCFIRIEFGYDKDFDE